MKSECGSIGDIHTHVETFGGTMSLLVTFYCYLVNDLDEAEALLTSPELQLYAAQQMYLRGLRNTGEYEYDTYWDCFELGYKHILKCAVDDR